MVTTNAPVRLLGIDPGTNILGFAVIELVQKKAKLLELGVVHLSQFEEHSHKLKKIYERVQQIIAVHRPEEMAIEAPFFGKNAQAMLKLGRAQGVAMAAGIAMGVEITEYAPRKIKQSVIGNGNASKEQVAALLAGQFDIDLSVQYLDATDALAVALCHFYQSNSPQSKSKAKGKSKNDWGSFVKNNPDKLQGKN